MRAVPVLATVLVMTAMTTAAVADDARAQLVSIGKALYEQRCGHCHARARGETSFAPTMFGILGRKAGSVEGFTYTPRITLLDLVWSEQTLWTWVQSTTFDTPLIAMRHVGVKQPAEADALVAYIATLR